MTYVSKAQRRHISEPLNNLLQKVRNRGVEVQAYTIARILIEWVRSRGITFASVAQALSVLEMVKMEIYSRLGGPYQDAKMSKHGDFFDSEEEIDKAAWGE